MTIPRQVTYSRSTSKTSAVYAENPANVVLVETLLSKCLKTNSLKGKMRELEMIQHQAPFLQL